MLTTTGAESMGAWLGLSAPAAFSLGVALLAAGALLDFFLFRLLRDKRGESLAPVLGKALLLVTLSTLCIIAGVLLLLL